MAKTTFSGPVVSKNGFIGKMTVTGPMAVFSGDTAAYPADDYPGALIIDTEDSDTLKFSDGTAWKAVTIAS